MAPLDHTYLLLGLPYQQARHIIYHARSNQYHLKHEGHTYVLTSSTPTSSTPILGQASFNQRDSLRLARTMEVHNLNTLVLLAMVPLIQKNVDVFTIHTNLSLPHAIKHINDFSIGAYLPNTSVCHLTPQATAKIKKQIGQHFDSHPLDFFSSSCAYPMSINLAKDDTNLFLAPDYLDLTRPNIQNHFLLPWMEHLFDHFQ